jgi:large subunit ribosomal protein L18
MTETRNEARRRRHKRVRQRIAGTTSIPRLCVFRSLKHIYAQIIDDDAGQTLVSASTLDKDVRAELAELEGQGKMDQAKVVGRRLAEKALSKGVKQVVFDRGGYVYHGRVKALADASRKGGLVF